MLYFPPKTKKHIIIFGAIAVALAVLAVVIVSLFFQGKTLQAPVTDLSSQENLQQKKIQKNMNEAAKRLENAASPEQNIQEEMNSAGEELKKNPAPSHEDMQKAANILNKH